MEIRAYREADWPDVWGMLELVFRAGETYCVERDIAEADARRLWVTSVSATYVAEDGGAVVGTYYLKPNQAGPGAHVCNCGYVVVERARGKGAATAMCVHSQAAAVEMGFWAMQFNHVVSTNVGAIGLWEKLGFEIVGTLPEAFRHPGEGYVDAYVMFKVLGGGDQEA